MTIERAFRNTPTPDPSDIVLLYDSPEQTVQRAHDALVGQKPITGQERRTASVPTRRKFGALAVAKADPLAWAAAKQLAATDGTIPVPQPDGSVLMTYANSR